jgi:hypothetical protein
MAVKKKPVKKTVKKTAGKAKAPIKKATGGVVNIENGGRKGSYNVTGNQSVFDAVSKIAKDHKIVKFRVLNKQGEEIPTSTAKNLQMGAEKEVTIKLAAVAA